MTARKENMAVTKNTLYMTALILVAAVIAFNQYTISSLGGGGLSIGSKDITLSADATIQEVAAAVLPSEADKLRPYTINGQTIELNLDKNNIFVQLDPFPPNGGRGGQAPQDLSPEGQQLYSKLMYGSAEKNYQDAVGGCLFCNAPGGAGGCFKKRALRGMTYSLIKQGWTEEEIIDEERLWMFYYFPGLAVKWATYYNQQNKDINEIPIDTLTFSRQGKTRVEAALQGQDLSNVVPDQVGGCF